MVSIGEKRTQELFLCTSLYTRFQIMSHIILHIDMTIRSVDPGRLHIISEVRMVKHSSMRDRCYSAVSIGRGRYVD